MNNVYSNDIKFLKIQKMLYIIYRYICIATGGIKQNKNSKRIKTKWRENLQRQDSSNH